MTQIAAMADAISTKAAGMWRTLRSVKPAMLGRLMAGSAMFLASKTALTWLLDILFTMPSWLNYLLVITFITVFGWLYHTLVTFRTTLSWKTLNRYVQQAIVMKIVDYAAYNFLVYKLAAGSVVAVLFASAAVFVVRIITYIVYVFEGHTDPDDVPIE